ncbi:unnamed protein product [Natator depressus]
MEGFGCRPPRWTSAVLAPGAPCNASNTSPSLPDPAARPCWRCHPSRPGAVYSAALGGQTRQGGHGLASGGCRRRCQHASGLHPPAHCCTAWAPPGHGPARPELRCQAERAGLQRAPGQALPESREAPGQSCHDAPAASSARQEQGAGLPALAQGPGPEALGLCRGPDGGGGAGAGAAPHRARLVPHRAQVLPLVGPAPGPCQPRPQSHPRPGGSGCPERAGSGERQWMGPASDCPAGAGPRGAVFPKVHTNTAPPPIQSPPSPDLQPLLSCPGDSRVRRGADHHPRWWGSLGYSPSAPRPCRTLLFSNGS